MIFLTDYFSVDTNFFLSATGYTLADEGESCEAACSANGLTCDTVMTADNNKVLERLQFSCQSTVAPDPGDKAEPYVLTSTGVCHGLFNQTNTACDVSKPGARRLCRCEKPGEYCWAN